MSESEKRPSEGTECPALQEARKSHREILDEWMLADPSRPLYTAVRACFIEKFVQLYVRIEATTSVEVQPDPSKVAAAEAPDLKCLEKDCMWLANLLFNRSNLWAVRDWQRPDWRKPAILKFLARSLERKQAGRPATKLRMAMEAKEMRLADQDHWTWPAITEALCKCGKRPHTIKCQDNIRREIIHLEKGLSEVGCSAHLGKTSPVSPMR